MIFVQVENIFQYYPECLVHPVSCTGVSHDTLSKQIKKSYPDYFREYTRACLRKHLKPGHANFYPLDVLFGTRFIITLTIRNNWQEKIRPETFKESLQAMMEMAIKEKCSTVAMPIMEEVPQSWLKERFNKFCETNNNCIEKVIFFEIG